MLRGYSRRHNHRLSDVAVAVLHDPASHPVLTTPGQLTDRGAQA
jgi:hypothetical protein